MFFFLQIKWSHIQNLSIYNSESSLETNKTDQIHPKNSNTRFVYPPHHTDTHIETDIKDPTKADISINQNKKNPNEKTRSLYTT